MHLLRVGTHRARALERGICQRATVRNPTFVRWQNSEMFAVPPKNRYRQYVSVPAFWRGWEALCILCVPSPPMFAYYSSTSGGNTNRFGYLLLETGITNIKTMSFACFIQSAKYRAVDLFLPACLRALIEGGCARSK